MMVFLPAWKEHLPSHALHSYCCIATSFDAERLFSFSGGIVSKLHNQLSEDSAHAAVMVGQWAGNPDLIAAKEFEAQLVSCRTKGYCNC